MPIHFGQNPGARNDQPGAQNDTLAGWQNAVVTDRQQGQAHLVQVQAQTPLKTPGDCTWGQHNELQDKVDAACKRPRRCEDSDTSSEIRGKIDKTAECISARNRINGACYRGGDAGHKEQVEIDQNGLQRCYKKLAAAEKREAQEHSPAFWKTMERLTGLTGAALVTYVIISEGSRAFPPRNLVPVP
jgi:hypothetical protein